MKRRICIIVLALTIVFTSIVPIFAIQEDCPREAPHRTIVAANDYHGYAGVTTSSKKRGISAKITMPSDFPDVSGSGESAWVSTSKDSNDEWVQRVHDITHHIPHLKHIQSITKMAYTSLPQ